VDRGDMKDWERLFARALQVVDAAQRTGQRGIVWSLGGGSALMRRHRHRRSAGVDLFLLDARMLHCVSPRLNEALADLCVDYVEEPAAVRMYFPEGEVAFIAGGLVTPDPVRRESILGRSVLVETSAEILARKLWHRAASLPARDLFDFAAVAAFEPNALRGVGGVLRARRAVLLEHLREHGEALREDFAALHAWQFHPGFEECVAALRTALVRSLPPPVLEQERGPYDIVRVDPATMERYEAEP
jgi:nucleotidyltransferase AbiEii toxin of type IV toxin-antitoxin system